MHPFHLRWEARNELELARMLQAQRAALDRVGAVALVDAVVRRAVRA